MGYSYPYDGYTVSYPWARTALNSEMPVYYNRPGSMAENVMKDPYDPHTAMAEALRIIQQALTGEAEDRAFYAYLIAEAPSVEDKNIITGIMNDEMKHYDMFRQLYYDLTGNMLPQTQEATFEKPASYCAGLRKALLGEQNAVVKYRKILFAMQNRRHINMMTEIITDELRHLGLYNYLYSKNNCTE